MGVITIYLDFSLHLARKFLSADIICSEKGTVSFEEQIMSKDKYPRIFLSQIEAIMFIILQILNILKATRFRRPIFIAFN